MTNTKLFLLKWIRFFNIISLQTFLMIILLKWNNTILSTKTGSVKNHITDKT